MFTDARVREQRVDLVASLLDQRYPAWHRVVDVEALKLSCIDSCVLGQMGRAGLGLGWPLEMFYLLGPGNDLDDVFVWVEYQSAWVAAVQDRVHRDTVELARVAA